MKERRSGAYRCLRGAALVACCAGAGGAARAAGDAGTTTVGGHVYRLPDGAFIDGIAEQGRQQDVLMKFALPQGGGDRASIPNDDVLVLASGAPSGDAETDARLAARVSRQAHSEASLDPHKRNDPLRATPGGEAAPSGFLAVATDPSDSLGDDVFVMPGLASPTEVISCSRRDPAKAIEFPDCTVVFGWRGVLMRVTFRRERLRQWKDVQDAVTGYFAAHEVKP